MKMNNGKFSFLSKKNIIAYSIIFVSLFIALAPVVLSHNYIRQDDLMWEIWPGMKISDFGYLYYNTVFMLVRPLCMLSFYITDLISINIHNAVYVRLMSVITLGIIGIFLYHWQLLFNANRILAITFSICAFTLPAYQVFAATGNYFLILTALLFTFGSMFCWYRAYHHSTNKKGYFLIGCLLFFASLLEYPLSSMYIWLLLFIYYLNTNAVSDHNQRSNKLFFYFISLTTVSMMIFYYAFSRLFHFIFKVDLSNGRAAVLDTSDLFSRFFRIFDVLSWHADFWWWKSIHSFMQLPIILLIIFFIFALIKINYFKRIPVMVWNIVKTLSISFFLFFLSYSPVLATPDLIITYRYAMVTMPLLLYVAFWSTDILLSPDVRVGKTIDKVALILQSILFVSVTLLGIFSANIMLADRIVGPHQHDFAYIQHQLSDKVLPLLKQNKKVIIHAITCREEEKHAASDPLISFEYGMRICEIQQQVIGVIIHSLNRMGYLSNFYRHNNVIYSDKQIMVKDTPWGTLIVNSPSNANRDIRQYVDKNQTIVEIDTRLSPPYEKFEFYKNLLPRKFIG